MKAGTASKTEGDDNKIISKCHLSPNEYIAKQKNLSTRVVIPHLHTERSFQ